MLRYTTGGESHGRRVTVILEGLPAGMPLRRGEIEGELARRRRGYGRSVRQRRGEKLEVSGGLRGGRTTGAPLVIEIDNGEWARWRSSLDPFSGKGSGFWAPRPGHADLAGAQKYGHRDLRDVLERSSARETAARTAAGAAARKMLSFLDIRLYSHVLSIADVTLVGRNPRGEKDLLAAEKRALRCLDGAAEAEGKRRIARAAKEGESLGGVFEVVVKGVPPGLGSYVGWERRLDANLARAVMSIPAVKGVEVGMGFGSTLRPGSMVHDEIFYERGGFRRRTNRAGGIEGGISNGEDIVVRAAMKPLPTLALPLHTVDLRSKKATRAFKERRDVCAVPAAGVVGEAVIALELARQSREKFGGDSMREMLANYRGYLDYLRKF